MDYTKLPQEIFNAEQDNLQKLAALFPAAVKDGLLDIAALKEELGQFEEVTAERYELSWAGKRNAKKASQSDVPGRTLKYIPEDSKNPDTTENLYIEGDNLEVLKLLRQNYYGAVKMIYIDPPYNTGNDFVYRDDFSQSKAESDEAEGETVDGERMVVNQKSGNRFHANWLNMMYPRLRVAKDLLREDGVIFISIDDGEIHSLKRLCDEIFGEGSFVADLGVVNNLKGRNDKKYIARANERLLMFVKTQDFNEHGLDLSEDVLSEYNQKDNNGIYRLLELRKRGGADTRAERPNMYYPFFVNPTSGEVSLEQTEKHPDKALPVKSNGVDGRWRWGKETASKNIHFLFGKIVGNKYNIYQKDYYESEEGARRVRPKSVLAGAAYSTDVATKEYRALMSNIDFSNPKPIELLKDLVVYSIGPESDAIVLDFFSGSATTAHAVMQLNAEDGGNRKFIMVQYPEVCDEKSEAAKAGYSTICEIGKERIRRAGEKIKAEAEAANAQVKLGEEPKQVPDIGFRVFRTADTNIRWTHEAVMGQLELDERILSDKDRLDFMPGYTDIDVVYEVLLRQRDIPLSAKVEKLSIGQRTYLFADAYVVCLDEKVTVELVEALAAVEPTPIKYVFRDSAFEDNISLKDETVRRLEAYIARNSGEQKKAYTVEFI